MEKARGILTSDVTHETIESVNFADEGAFAYSTDRWVT
jgi:hypothetical protein